MPNEIIGTIGLIIVILLMFLKVPLGVTFSLIGGIGTTFLIGFDGAMSRFASVPYNWTTEYALTALPMFVLMGFIIAETDITKDLYSTARKWIGHLPGGLAMTTLLVTALFGAVSGAAVAAATTVGLTCYPEMKRHGYSPALSSGVIAFIVCLIAVGAFWLGETAEKKFGGAPPPENPSKRFKVTGAAVVIGLGFILMVAPPEKRVTAERPVAPLEQSVEKPQVPAPPHRLTRSTPSWRAQSSSDWPSTHSPLHPIGSKSMYTVIACPAPPGFV